MNEDWKIELTKTAEEETERERTAKLESLRRGLDQIDKALEIKKKLILSFRERPTRIFGTFTIYVNTNQHLLAHDAAKCLGIYLKKIPEADGFNYRGMFQDIGIDIYGMQKALNCKIVRKAETKTIIEYKYETVCE